MSDNTSPIEVRCKCGHAFRVKSEAAGKSVRCPKCKHINRISREKAKTFTDEDQEYLPQSEPTGNSPQVASFKPPFDESPSMPSENEKASVEATLDPQPIPVDTSSKLLKSKSNTDTLLIKTAVFLLFALVFFSLLYTIFESFSVLSPPEYVFDDQNAIGFTANQLRLIRSDIAFFKILVLFVLLERTFVRMLNVFLPAPSTK
jgi:phage FluMu protein Com